MPPRTDLHENPELRYLDSYKFTTNRLGVIEERSNGTLPTSMSLALSQSNLPDEDLARAAMMLARRLDITPEWLFGEPISLERRFGERFTAFKDPVTGGFLTLETARRLIKVSEPEVIKTILERFYRPPQIAEQRKFGEIELGVSPKRIADLVMAMAPLDGDTMDFQTALGAAVQIGRDVRVDPIKFAANLRVLADIRELDELDKLALAHGATASGERLRNRADAAAYFFRVSGQEKVAKDIKGQAEQEAMLSPYANRPGTVGQEAFLAAESRKAEILSTGGVTAAGIRLYEDIKNNRGNYIAEGQRLAADMRLSETAFKHSIVGKVVGGALYGVNRVVGAFSGALDLTLGTATSLSLELQGREGETDIAGAIAEQWHRAKEDFWGRGFFAEHWAQDTGQPLWAGVLVEGLLGWYLGPDVLALKAIKASREAHLAVNAAEKWPLAVSRFLDEPMRGPVAGLFGSSKLRGVTAPEFLTRAAWQSTNPEELFARAQDTFRRYFSVNGIDDFLARRIFDHVQAAKTAGQPMGEIVKDVRGLFATAFGVRPATGSLAERISRWHSLLEEQATDLPYDLFDEASYPMTADAARVQQAEHALGLLDEFHGAFGERVIEGTVRDLPADIFDSLAMSGDPSITLPARRIMEEVPHLGSRLRPSNLRLPGEQRILRSLFRSVPQVRSGQIVIEFEVDAPRQFEAALVRSQVLSRQEVAEGRIELTRALDVARETGGPREAAALGIIGKYDRLIQSRIGQRYGLSDEQTSRLVDELGKRFGWPKEQTYGTVTHERPGGLKPTPEEIKDPFLTTQLLNQAPLVDPVVLRRSIAESIGTIRKWRAVHMRALSGVVPEATFVRIPVRKAFDRVFDLLIHDLFLTIWKPLVVIRPAYILRVVGVEEQTRFLATAGLSARMGAGKRTGRILSAIDGMVGADDKVLRVPIFHVEDGVQIPLTEVRATTKAPDSVEAAILALSERDVDRATIRNLMGFNKQDTALGNRLAEKIRAGELLTDDEIRNAAEMLKTYRRQLADLGIKVKVKPSTPKSLSEARTYVDSFEEVPKTVEFGRPGLLPDEPLANNLAPGLALPGAESFWEKSAARFNLRRWGAVSGEDKHFFEAWAHALRNQFAKDPLGAMYLRDIVIGKSEVQSIDDAIAWLNGKGKPYAKRLMGTDDFTPEALRNQVETGVKIARQYTGEFGRLAQAALDDVLDPSMLRAIPVQHRPQYVHGPQLELMLGQEGPIKRGTAFMHNAILRAPTNRLSRQPYFKHWYSRVLENLVQTAVDSGATITDDVMKGFQAEARQFALEQVRRIMFDFTRQSRLGEMLSWLMPFFQPFSEAFVVYGRILRQNPAMVAYIARLYDAGRKSGFLREDPDTGETVIPTTNWLAAVPLGIALGWLPAAGGRGNVFSSGWALSAPLSSFNFFFQSAIPLPMPGGGTIPIPFAGLNPQALWLLQQGLEHDIVPLPDSVKMRLSSWAFQYGELSWSHPESLLPGWLRHTIEGAMPAWLDREVRMQQTEFLRLQQVLGYGPEVDDKPVPGVSLDEWRRMERGQREKRLAAWARSQSRGLSYFRALFTAFGFAAPQVTFPTEVFEDEHRALVEKLGPQKGSEEFMRLHPDLSLITLAKSIWSKENDTPVSIPANKFVQQLLEGPGGKDFARNHPRWVFAIIPHELREGKFDAGVFFEQIATGQREPLTPEEFLRNDQMQRGWDAWFARHEGWVAQQETELEGVSQSSVTWQRAKDTYDRDVQSIRDLYPDWAVRFDTFSRQGVDPRVLAEARQLAGDSTFVKTQVGTGLREYLSLRDDLWADLSANNITSVRNQSAENLGLTKRYDDGVTAIIAEHPDFELAYRAFFAGDLQGVPTKGEQLRDALSSAMAAQIAEWEIEFKDRREGPSRASTDLDRSKAFVALREWTNQAYELFDENSNPAIINWRSRTPQERQDYQLGALERPYLFLTRLDRQEILGDKTDTATEKLWDQIDRARIDIEEYREEHPEIPAAALYRALDAWVVQQARGNRLFAQQVQNANTWGYVAERIIPQVFGENEQAGAYWRAVLDALRTVQAVADQYELHGESDFDPRKRLIYGALRGRLLTYVGQLKESNPVFAQQWDFLENETDGPLINSFMPTNYYPLGGSRA